MDIKYLRDFVVLSQIMHFQEASEVLFISQSTLSKHIKTIEKDLGHELFIRSNRKILLSDFGKSFLPYAEQIVNIQEEYTAELLNKDIAAKKLVIGYVPMVTLYTFMEFFSSFARSHPEYQYSFIQGNKKQLTEWLQQKKVDFILTDDTNLDEEVFRKFFYKLDSLVAVLPRSHTLAGKETVTLTDIMNEPYIQLEENDTIAHLLRAQGYEDHFIPAFTIDKIHVLFDFIAKGLGVSVLTSHVAEHFHIDGTVLKPITPQLLFEIHMVSRKGRLPLATRSFARYLEELAGDRK